jgi:uncharacterized RDD family membrane protein YckC
MTEQPAPNAQPTQQPDPNAPPRPAIYWEAPDEPAGPAPGFEFGGFGARLLAYIIDVLVILGALLGVFVLTLPFAAIGSSTSRWSASVVIITVVYVVLLIGYFPWFWARGGATPGMRIMHLRVVRDADGQPISTGQALMRLLGYLISGWIVYLGFIWILIDKRRRGWHDLIAGTVVVKEL